MRLSTIIPKKIEFLLDATREFGGRHSNCDDNSVFSLEGKLEMDVAPSLLDGDWSLTSENQTVVRNSGNNAMAGHNFKG